MERNEAGTLKQTCFRAVRKHFAALDSGAIADLPVPLIQDLLPQLSVSQVDQLQPGLNRKGISTHSAWAGILKHMYGPDYPVDQLTEDKAKEGVMRRLFTDIFYGSSKPFVEKMAAEPNTPSFLLTAAEYVDHFPVYPHTPKSLQRLVAEQPAVLNLMERRIRGVGVCTSADLSGDRMRPALHVLHRLLDHGAARKLVVTNPSPTMLVWLLNERGSRHVNPLLEAAPVEPESEGEEAIPRKRARPAAEGCGADPRALCRSLSSGGGGPSAAACPRGRIECLEVRQCGFNSFRLLWAYLPTFFCLRSFTLQCFYAIENSDLLDLIRDLKQLSASPHSRLAHLSISSIYSTRILQSLLDAVPKVTSLHVELLTMPSGLDYPEHAKPDLSELSLQRLSLNVSELQTDLCPITLALRRSPRLTSLHISGLTLGTPGSSLRPLFTALSESVHRLKSLSLENMNLSNCLPEVLGLLRDCRLEELRLADCRLLEKCGDKEESLQQLVGALRAVSSLHTLSLAQNRLAKNVSALSELFSGPSPSSVAHLDISSNYIQSAELLELAHRLRRRRPPRRLTLNLSMNPGDRDPQRWNEALGLLRPFCLLLMKRWSSTDTMMDHISNM